MGGTRSFTEVLATSARTGREAQCPFSNADLKKHPSTCICKGTGKIKACQTCHGSGWDAEKNRKCQGCGGQGAL